MERTPKDSQAFLEERWELKRIRGYPTTYGMAKHTMNKLEFTGTVEMRRSAMKCVFEMLKYGNTNKHVKALLDSTSKEKDESVLSSIDNCLWYEFAQKGNEYGRNFRKHEGQRARLVGTIEGGYRIIVPYNPPDPKAISIELRRNKEILTIHVEDGEALRIFGRVIYKLGGNPNALKESIEINGEVLRLGHWLAAFTCRVMGDEAGYMMYHDEGLENVP